MNNSWRKLLMRTLLLDDVEPSTYQRHWRFIDNHQSNQIIRNSFEKVTRRNFHHISNHLAFVPHFEPKNIQKALVNES